jgi:FtsZ-binding cell division protein ZapB
MDRVKGIDEDMVKMWRHSGEVYSVPMEIRRLTEYNNRLKREVKDLKARINEMKELLNG